MYGRVLIECMTHVDTLFQLAWTCIFPGPTYSCTFPEESCCIIGNIIPACSTWVLTSIVRTHIMPLNISFSAVQRHGAFEWLQILYTQSLLSFFTRWSDMFNSFYVYTQSPLSFFTRWSDMFNSFYVYTQSLLSFFTRWSDVHPES